MKQKFDSKKRIDGHILQSVFLRDSDIIPQSQYVGLELAKYYSLNFRLTVEHIYYSLYAKFPECRVAVGIYGSAGRQEMAAYSDADVLIITGSESTQEREFRKQFSIEMAKFGYSKVDIPDWGTIRQLSKICSTNIVEGNQILESKIVCGDPSLIKSFRAMVKKQNTLERSKRNILFQLFCYDYYYSKRRKNGYINVKYSAGGTRDILFFIWIARHTATSVGIQPPISITNSLSLLFEHGSVNRSEYEKLLRSISNVMLLRSEALKINKGTDYNGLSLIETNLQSLQKSTTIRHLFPDSSFYEFTDSMRTIAKIKEKLVNGFITENFGYRGKLIIRARQQAAKNKLLKPLTDNRPEIILANLWLIGEKIDSQKLLQSISKQKQWSWEFMASMLSLNDLPQSIIHSITEFVLGKMEYGYILKLVAQHPHTSKQTLRLILNSKIDERYKQLARIAKSAGNSQTNFQV